MKDSRVIVALVFGVSLIISVSMLSSAIKSIGGNLENAARFHSVTSVNIPSNFTLNPGDNGNPLRCELKNKQ